MSDDALRELSHHKWVLATLLAQADQPDIAATLDQLGYDILGPDRLRHRDTGQEVDIVTITRAVPFFATWPTSLDEPPILTRT